MFLSFEERSAPALSVLSGRSLLLALSSLFRSGLSVFLSGLSGRGLGVLLSLLSRVARASRGSLSLLSVFLLSRAGVSAGEFSFFGSFAGSEVLAEAVKRS